MKCWVVMAEQGRAQITMVLKAGACAAHCTTLMTGALTSFFDAVLPLFRVLCVAVGYKKTNSSCGSMRRKCFLTLSRQYFSTQFILVFHGRINVDDRLQTKLGRKNIFSSFSGNEEEPFVFFSGNEEETFVFFSGNEESQTADEAEQSVVTLRRKSRI
jgi:hypothetical protein